MSEVLPSGPRSADIMIVGEAPGKTEEAEGKPFMGASGIELTKMLMEVGVDRRRCFITNVCRTRPPGNNIEKFFLNKTDAKKNSIPEMHGRYPLAPITEGIQDLFAEVMEVKPRLILAFGNTPLWALTGEEGIGKYRGSMFLKDLGYGPVLILPTYHPAAILRMWTNRRVAVQDIRRGVEWLKAPTSPPDYNFIVAPTADQVITILQRIKQTRDPISLDIETQHGHIDCLGIGWSPTEAICIPFISAFKPYFQPSEEALIYELIRDLVTDGREVRGQNFSYDAAYLHEKLLISHRAINLFDTMIAHHTCFPGTIKGLNMLSSLYCRWHMYWKDEGKAVDNRIDPIRRWTYNCKDCVTTFEIADPLKKVISTLNQTTQYEFQIRKWHRAMKTSLRGVRINTLERQQMSMQMIEDVGEVERQLYVIAGDLFPPAKSTGRPWYTSSTQTGFVLYRLLKYDAVLHKDTKRSTTNDAALQQLKRRDPLLRPLLDRVLLRRSQGVFLSTFLTAPLSPDGRLHWTYNIAGTQTFRMSSSEDPFGNGTNMQNPPKGEIIQL